MPRGWCPTGRAIVSMPRADKADAVLDRHVGLARQRRQVPAGDARWVDRPGRRSWSRGRGPRRSGADAPGNRRPCRAACRWRGLRRRCRPPARSRSGSGCAQRTLARMLSQIRFIAPAAGRIDRRRTVEFGDEAQRIVDLPGRAEAAGRKRYRFGRDRQRRRGRSRGRAGTGSRAPPDCRMPPTRRCGSFRRSPASPRFSKRPAR